MVRHHPTEDLLIDYATGALGEAEGLVVATHLALCPDCRALLLAFDAIGGALIDDTVEADMAEGSLEATFARITGGSAAAAPAPRAAGGLFPAPLRDYVGGDLSAVKWRSTGMGVRQAILKTEQGATAIPIVRKEPLEIAAPISLTE
jgi:putative transcriptional regulator